MNKSFADAVLAKKNKVYDLRFTSDDGESVYYFFLANPLKENTFIKKWEDNSDIDLNDYGEIISAGYGAPCEDLKNKMQDKYGIIYN